MTGKLEGLVIPVMEPLGYPHGWAGEIAKRIQGAVPADCGQLVLNSESITDVLTCGGLWQGKEVVTPSPDHVFWLRRKLITTSLWSIWSTPWCGVRRGSSTTSTII